MKNPYMARSLLIICLLWLCSSLPAQSTYIDDDFSSATGTSSPNWSVVLLSGLDNPSRNWRYDNLGGRLITAPMALSFAMSDTSLPIAGSFSSALQSPGFNVSGAAKVLLEFDYMFRQLGATATVEAFDGATWNNVATLNENDSGVGGNSHVLFDVSSAMGGSSNGKIRFVHSATSDWWYAVDNVQLYDPPPRDIGLTAILKPVFDPKSCVAPAVAPILELELANAGSLPLPFGTKVAIDVFINGALQGSTCHIITTVLASEARIMVRPNLNLVLPQGGPHTLRVTATIPADPNPLNGTLSLTYSLPGHAPKAFGWSENFDSLPSNGGSFAMTEFSVPAGWDNAQDDGASVAGNAAPDWGPNNGTTGSNQGPQADHTTGASLGNYMYIEDSPSQGGSIELRGPCLDTSLPTVGLPTLQFYHFSHAQPGVNDNVLEVDIINQTTGGVVTMSVYSQGGFGDNNWHVANIDLSSFAPDLIKPQWRTSNDNSTFTDDVAIDDILYFDLVATAGQAPQPGNAVFDINNANNSLGQNVASGANGPYSANVSVGGNLSLTWSGQTNSVMLCVFGAPNDGIATYPAPIGQLDVGSFPLDINGIPAGLSVLGDGNLATTSLFHSQFFTGPAGNGGVSLTLSPIFLPGYLTRFQCVMNPAGQFFLSNAVDVTVL